MTEKLVTLLVAVLVCWFAHKDAKNSPPSSVNDLFLKFRFNIISYGAGFCAVWLAIVIIIDFLET